MIITHCYTKRNTSNIRKKFLLIKWKKSNKFIQIIWLTIILNDWTQPKKSRKTKLDLLIDLDISMKEISFKNILTHQSQNILTHSISKYSNTFDNSNILDLSRLLYFTHIGNSGSIQIFIFYPDWKFWICPDFYILIKVGNSGWVHIHDLDSTFW